MFSWFKQDPSVRDPLVLGPAPKQPRPSVVFSKSVGVGFVDSDGRWYQTQADADRSSAKKHMVSRMTASEFSRGMVTLEGYVSREDVLAEPDTLRAMAILGRDA